MRRNETAILAAKVISSLSIVFGKHQFKKWSLPLAAEPRRPEDFLGWGGGQSTCLGRMRLLIPWCKVQEADEVDGNVLLCEWLCHILRQASR